jgi:hypothetical protein
MKESDLQNTVIEYAQLRGWKVAHFRSVRVQRKDGTVYYQTPVQADGEGYPDMCMARGNRLVFAELKSDNGIISPAQDAWLKALAETEKCEVYTWKPCDFEQEIVEVLA